VFVIAINGRLLRPEFLPIIDGASLLPYALQATLAIGPRHIRIDAKTQEVLGSGHHHQPQTENANGAPVPTDNFFDDRFKPVSAIWATDLGARFDKSRLGLVHNPFAINPVGQGGLPAEFEYLTKIEGDEYEVAREPGILKPA